MDSADIGFDYMTLHSMAQMLIHIPCWSDITITNLGLECRECLLPLFLVFLRGGVLETKTL